MSAFVKVASVGNGSWLGPRLHQALTAVLALGAVAFLGLAASGRLHFGAAPPAAPSESGAALADAAKASPVGGNKPGGRYRVEAMQDAGRPFSAAGRAGFLGIPYRELIVFRYQGGLLECRLQLGQGEDKIDVQSIPADWAPLLGRRESADVGSGREEGYLVVGVLESAATADQAMQPYLPHLFGALAAGPGGPASLLPWPVVTCNHLRELRVFLTARPPEGEAGADFTVSAPARPIVFRTQFGPNPGDLAVRRLGGGADLTAGARFPLVEWRWESSELTLEGRFLTAEERVKVQAAPVGEGESARPR